MVADNNLKNLEHKVQIELKKVNSWLCQNKLSLNFSKTNYMLINKQPLKTCECNFKIAVNGITINRAHTVKYLGLFNDNKSQIDVANKLFVHTACQMHRTLLQIAQFCFKRNPLHAIL